jgi:N-methylhydantoinase A/oxoprolinase/acetone carboxylase beta subunit
MSNKVVQSGSRIGLGIDAGGTYTDAVVYDLEKRAVLAKAKSLTTYHDLVEGIRGVLAQLPAQLLAQIEVTALSTTLATNSIVEGRGHKVGLITLAPWEWWGEQIGHQPFIDVPGSVGITGDIAVPLDEKACRKAIKQLVDKEKCAALAVAAYAVERNPSQCNRVRELIRGKYDLPVICSHEISRTEYSVDAGQTAVANARLLPVIRELLDAVHQALGDFGIPGKLMVVKGDGTIVDEHIARERPVETILSGPAASVSGARILAGLNDALVLDIGGTTTDCAVVRDGYVAVAKNGARVGSWIMSVDAVEMSTTGLGGDSRIDFDINRRIKIGPVRCLPFAYLAHEHPQILDALDSFDMKFFSNTNDASALDFLVLSRSGPLDFTPQERALVDLLQTAGPLSVLEARTRLGASWYTMLPTTRLEECGMVKRAALTPTDILHVSGEFARWHVEAAQRALEIFSLMLGKPTSEAFTMIRTALTRRLFEEIIRREVSLEKPQLHELPKAWTFLLDKAFADDGVGLEVKMAVRKPVVAIGAPAGTLVPAIAEHLQTEIVVPEHAEVANAVGAIGSEIMIHQQAIIRFGTAGFVLYSEEEREEFDSLETATDKAAALCREQAMEKALAAGAMSPQVEVKYHDRTGSVSDGSHIFLERWVTAVATGRAF